MQSDLDYDLRLRLALFQHIDAVRRESGGVVPSRRLNQGFTFEGRRIPIWNQQKGIFRPAALRDTGIALTIQTSFKSPYDDRSDAGEARFIYRYRGQDPRHPDNVALRRALETRRPILYLVAVEPAVYQPIFPAYVVADVPGQLSFMLIADTIGSISAGSLDPDEGAPLKAYITREVKQRLHQRRFRYMVVSAYRARCAMCRLRHEELLDAAHIRPDSDPRGIPEVPNGLALCRIYHGAFDVGIVGVDPDYGIHVRRDVLEEADGPMLRHGLQDLHGARLLVPRPTRLKPNRDYLAERFEKFRRAG